MEFLRFGSSIPGAYWGCCACDIIQNFKVDPDDKASIQLVSGDGGGAITSGDEMLFAGPTWRDIFLQRIRSGTFDKRDMPNHAFIAILTDWQVTSSIGEKWMKILHESGFEFVRTVANSVYTGAALGNHSAATGASLNYIFMLVRNIGVNGAGNPYAPPAAWAKLGRVVPEVWAETTPKEQLARAKEVHMIQTAIWKKVGEPKFLKRSQLPPDTPVILAGTRVAWAQQQSEGAREQLKVASGLFKEQKAQVSLKGGSPAPAQPLPVGLEAISVPMPTPKTKAAKAA